MFWNSYKSNVHILNLLYIYASDTVKIVHIKNYNNLQVIVSFGMKFDEENIFRNLKSQERSDHPEELCPER